MASAPTRRLYDTLGRLAARVREPAAVPAPRRAEFDLLLVLRSRGEFEAAIAGSAPRLEYERALGAGHEGDESWHVAGYCLACDAPATFLVDWDASVAGAPNWRERLQCLTCGLNNRQRFVAHLVNESAARDVYLYEQITQFWHWAQRTLPSVVGSEYLGPDVAPGAVVDGVRHEDALALTFADASLDLIVSNDVFEHVPDIDASLAEAARVLRPGGRMLFSVPFHHGEDVTVRRATLDGSGLHHLLEPQYHGNPVDPEAGSLVFYDYGWDLLDRCRAAGFADAHVIGYWSALYGHIGAGLQLVFAVTR